MSAPTKEQVTEKLKKVKGPDLESNIVDLGMVSEIFIADGKVMFSLSVPAEKANDLDEGLAGLRLDPLNAVSQLATSIGQCWPRFDQEEGCHGRQGDQNQGGCGA